MTASNAILQSADGLDVLPLRTPTLPPAMHTNTVFVGRRDVWIVDPAPPWDDPRKELLAATRSLCRDGRRARGIVLTHHHADHVGGAEWLAAETGLEIWAHRRTAELLEGRVHVHHALEEGDELRGSDDDDDGWQVLLTPGHASGHIVLWEPRRALMIVGDMVAAVGTIVVSPPDGHMRTYIEQLRRLAQLKPRRAVPAHGATIEAPVALFEHYVAHRLDREGKVAAALDARPRSLAEITADSYRELPVGLHALAAQSALAHLLKLAEEGRARRVEGERWAALR